MLRCPDQYCCERSGDCTAIDTCSPGRIGTLCGRCSDDLTESLFSANCFPMDKCYTLLFGLLYAGCVVIYSFFLGTFNDIKKELAAKTSKLFKMLKNKLRTSNKSKTMEGIEVAKETEDVNLMAKNVRKNSRLVDALLLDNPSNKSETVTSLNTMLETRNWKSQTITNNLDNELKEEIKKNDLEDGIQVEKNTADTDSGMKYVQIMLYYVQDATLFKIHLLNAKQQSENFLVKILQFSPEILTVYYKVSDLCFTKNTTAVMKVLLSSMFGPCIILLLSIVYILHWILSRHFGKDSINWEILRSKLTQAFLLTILFSYQKIIKGAFSLIQCVDIDDIKVLYIQGNIQCYTWWQVATEIYLYISVVPVFITLAICPFLVKNKEMSVAMLILACLVPVPVLFYQIILTLIRSIRNYRKSKKVQKQSINEVLDYIRQIIWYIPMHYEDRNIPFNKETDTDTSFRMYVDGAENSSLQETPHSCTHNTEKIENIENCLRYRINKVDMKEGANGSDVRCTEDITMLSSDQKTKSEEVVSYILLKHYRTLRFLGIPMTWLGVHKLYRMALVACYTYIKEPLPRLSAMTILVMVMGLATMGIKPYKDDKAKKLQIYPTLQASSLQSSMSVSHL